MQVHNLLDVETHLATLRRMEEGRAGPLRRRHALHRQRATTTLVARHAGATRWISCRCNYSAIERQAEEPVLPLAQERGIAVLVNRPFAEGALFKRLSGRALPAWAAELDCRSWSELLLNSWCLIRQ